MSLILSCKNISKSYGDDDLFNSLNIDFKDGDQIGLIGMNGSGKSTFLRIAAGLSHPDIGEIVTRPNQRIIYLEQEDRLDPKQTIDQLLYNSIKAIPFDEKERHAIVQRAIGKGGFEDPSMTAGELSGGWKKRLAITRVLCCRPDILLLDEPTNHLDISGILWLENILKAADFTFIVVSHDRAFLENVCQNVMEIGRYYPSGYFRIQGGYKNFKKQRDKFLEAQQKKQASMFSKMRREDEWLRQGPKARSTKAKFRIEQARLLRQELNAVKQRNRETASVDIDFHSTGRQTKKLLRVRNLKKSMGSRTLFSNLTFEMGPGFCLGIAGENGSGKSTLLSLLEKKTRPDEGRVVWAENLKVAVFDQKRSTLDPEATLKEALNPAGGDSVNYKNRPVHIVTWAKRFLFMPDQLETPVKTLSGGEQARIIMANIMLAPCDLLLLDEPTNDLDILSLEVLEKSIAQFDGAVIIVSHDRYLMDRVCHRILYIDPDNETNFFKDFSQVMDYRVNHESRLKNQKQKNEKATKAKSAVLFSFKDKYELDNIEEKILSAEAEVETLSGKIQEPDIVKDAEKMAHYCTLLKNSEETVHNLYARWEYLEKKKLDAGNKE